MKTSCATTDAAIILIKGKQLEGTTPDLDSIVHGTNSLTCLNEGQDLEMQKVDRGYISHTTLLSALCSLAFWSLTGAPRYDSSL